MCGTRLALLVRFTPMRNPVSIEVNNLLGNDITCCPPTSIQVHTQRNTQEQMQKNNKTELVDFQQTEDIYSLFEINT